MPPTTLAQSVEAFAHLTQLLTDADLDRARVWGDYDRFRLHRFDAHMRQHTVQIDKALRDLGQEPTEVRRLLRLIYAALAEAEGTAIAADELDVDLQQQTASAITAFTAEIAPLLD